MAFTLDFPVDEAAAKPAPSAPPAGIGFAGISLNFDDVPAEPGEPAAAGQGDQWQEVSTKLDLAKAYQEMGEMTERVKSSKKSCARAMRRKERLHRLYSINSSDRAFFHDGSPVAGCRFVLKRDVI